jgi:lysophospholipase L1-like esterase
MSVLRWLAFTISFSTGLLLAVFAAADESGTERKVELKQNDHIIFFGDSLTALAGAEQPKQHVTKGYVRIVRETLHKAHPDKNITVGWVATGGHTVPDLLERVDKDVIAKKPTIVVIQIGCNDARRLTRSVSRPAWRSSSSACRRPAFRSSSVR